MRRPADGQVMTRIWSGCQLRRDERPLAEEPNFSASRPRVLFEGDYAVSGPGLAAYDVSDDGSRFLMVREHAEKHGAEVHLVVGWQRELAKLSSGE